MIEIKTLLTVIVTWLSVGFDLPASYQHPRIEFVSEAKMKAMQRRGHAVGGSSRARGGGTPPARRTVLRDVEALYDDSSQTIYLPDDWTGATPAETSILVHEMVHHLQNVAGKEYACPQEREKLAYDAQNRWLARYGHNLIDEFDLDPLTLLLRTKCMR